MGQARLKGTDGVMALVNLGLLTGHLGKPGTGINRAVKPGELFATFHTPAVFLNQVTSPHRDRHTLTSEYKVTAVRIDKL